MKEVSSNPFGRAGWSLFGDTVVGGSQPLERDGDGNFFVYPTEEDALAEIRDIEDLHREEFLQGLRDEEEIDSGLYPAPVVPLPDGSVSDHYGRVYKKADYV